MARPRKPAKSPNLLQQAIEFVSLVQRDEKDHCVFKDGWCVGSNGVMTIACRIEDQIEACPQTKRLAAALRLCGSTLSLALPEPERLTVVSGPLRAAIPCLPDPPPLLWADEKVAPLNEFFIEGLKAISHIASESGDKVYLHSLLVKDQTIFSTNSAVLIEYWHGNSLPPQFVLPKPAVSVLLKINKKLTGFGFSGNSATFHFEDESWFRTQLYEDAWPNVDAVLAKVDFEQVTDIPKGLFDAAKSISNLVVGHKIKFDAAKLSTGAGTHSAAMIDVDGLEDGPTIHIDHLLAISGIAKKFLVTPDHGMLAFTGDRLRGVVVCSSQNQEQPKA